MKKYQYVCPKCGRYTEYNSERHGLCIDCFTEHHSQKIDEKIKVSIKVCIGCSRLEYGKEWFNASIDNFKKILTLLIRKTSLRFYDFVISRIDEDLLLSLRELKKVFIPLNINISTENSVSRYVEVVFQKALCDVCSKKSSGKYYECVMHLRFSKNIASSVLEATQEFIETTWRDLDKFETVDIKKEGKQGIAIRWSNRKIAEKYLRFLKEKFSIMIIKKYKEHIDVFKVGNKNRRLTISKYVLRIMEP